MGTVWAQRGHAHRLTLVNRGDQSVTFKEVTESCSCTVARPAADVIPPGAEAPVDLLVNLTGVDPLPGQFETDVAFELEFPDGKRTTAVARLTANVIPSPFESPESAVHFGEVIHGIDLAPRQSLSLSVDESVSALEVRGPAESSEWITLAELAPAGAADRYDLRVELAAGMPLGEVFQTVEISGVQDGERRTFVVPVTARVVPDVQAFPSQLIFGTQPVGSQVSEHVTISTRSGRPLDSVVVAEAPPEVRAETVNDLSDDYRQVLRIACDVQTSGLSTQSLILEVRLPDESDPLRIEVPVTLHGLPRAAVSDVEK
jgi:hypothetical protein